MEDMQENTTGIVPEEQENTAAAAETAENKTRPWYKLPIITIPAVIALLVMVYLFLKTAYTSMLRYNAIDGINSPFVGLRNYGNIRSEWLATAAFNTIGIRLLLLLVCGGLAAAMCCVYRKIKTPGKLLTAACLWLIPVGLPAAMIGAPIIKAVPDPSGFTCAIAYLMGSGLQTLGIFCFAAGIFAYLKKNPFHGLLAAVLVWLLKNIGMNAMDAGIHSRISVSLLTDDRDYLMYLSGGIAHSAALSVVKTVLQVTIGVIAVVLLRKKTRSEGLREKTTRPEIMMIPIAAVCLAVAHFLYKPAAGTISNNVMNALSCSLLSALGGAAAGGLIAWSFVCLLKGASDHLFGIIALVLSAAMSCLLEQYLLFSKLRMIDTVFPHALTAAFDERVILLVVILAFILRFKESPRRVSLFLSLALLAGACTWGKILSSISYDYGKTLRAGMLFYNNVWNNYIAEGPYALIEGSGLDPKLLLNLVMAVPPLLMGAGAAFLMKRAFTEPKE